MLDKLRLNAQDRLPSDYEIMTTAAVLPPQVNP
jgi:hypothetical protein